MRNVCKRESALARVLNVLRLIARDLGSEMPFYELTLGIVIIDQKTNMCKLKLKASEGRHALPILVRALEVASPSLRTTSTIV